MKRSVLVKLKAKHANVLEKENGSLEVSVHASPIDNKANEELVELLADYFEVSKDSIEILHGHTSREKLVEICLWQKR